MQPSHMSPRSHGIINNFPVELEYIRFPEKLFKTQVRNAQYQCKLKKISIDLH